MIERYSIYDSRPLSDRTEYDVTVVLGHAVSVDYARNPQDSRAIRVTARDAIHAVGLVINALGSNRSALSSTAPKHMG